MDTRSQSSPSPREQTLAEPERVDALLAEIAALPASAALLGEKNLRVYAFHAHQAPVLMREIGRCRQRTFRAVGEGSTSERDLDAFDARYLQLALWDERQSALAGGYRLGCIGELVRAEGEESLYASSLFSMRPELMAQLSAAVELGRSFVVEEYQRSFLPLMLLWRGIGAVLSSRPDLYLLTGVLSVSARYSLRSREQIAGFLLADDRRSPLSALVRAKTPFEPSRYPPAQLQDLEADIVMRDGRKIPVLVRQYLQLGMRGLACGIDRGFGGCLDILCAADLREAPLSQLRRYMGSDAAAAFVARHPAMREVA